MRQLSGTIHGATEGAFFGRPLSSISTHGGVEIVEVASQSKTAASPFEGLGLRRSHGVILVGPLLAGPGMCAKAVDCHLAGNQDLAGNDLGVAFGTGDVVHRDRLVAASPALRADQHVETVGVSTRVGIRYDLPAGAVVGGVRYPPQNLVERKGHFQFGQQVLHCSVSSWREVSLAVIKLWVIGTLARE